MGSLAVEYTLTIRCKNAKELQEATALLSRKDVRGSAEDKSVNAESKEAAYNPSCERTRRAMDALQKCQRIKLADAGTKLEAWARAFPNVDMAYWITKQDAWAVSSDTKWSTKGWARHLNWRLSKSQDEARGSGMPVTPGVTPKTQVTDPAVEGWARE